VTCGLIIVIVVIVDSRRMVVDPVADMTNNRPVIDAGIGTTATTP
jgi:hypothetical protein